jgi:hypothetical protein
MRTILATAATTALLSTSLLATACGPNCQSTCNRLYQENECNIQSAGASRSELVKICNDECEAALDTPGELGDYDPHVYTPKSVTTSLENDQQAAAWMDCIDVKSCELLADGYCAPVW